MLDIDRNPHSEIQRSMSYYEKMTGYTFLFFNVLFAAVICLLFVIPCPFHGDVGSLFSVEGNHVLAETIVAVSVFS